MKFYIKTYGCQMNLRDSDAATAMLCERGYEPTKVEDEADIIILNSCSVRGKAEDKVIGKAGFLKKLKRKKPDLLLGIMGCMAQRLGDELFDKIPHLDFVIGTEQLHTITDIVDAEVDEQHKFVNVEHQDDVLTNMSAHHQANTKISEFIAIMRGCDRFCTYCIVPHVRGRRKSRDISDIIKEAKKLVQAGIVEITLLGQNVAAFGLDGTAPPIDPKVSPFARLLEAVCELEGIKRVRFTSPHPSFFNDDLIETIARLPKVCRGIHLPLQSGSDSVLKRMNRPYTSEQFLEIVRKLKSNIPGITFSTDIIVGFPGETDEDFEATRRVFNEVEFDNAFIFKYSPRRGTGAAKYDDQLDDSVKEGRNQSLLKDLGRITERHHNDLLGEEVEVMVEGVSTRNEEKWRGLTQTNQVVIFDPDSSFKPGDIVAVKVTRATRMTLYGDVVSI